MKQFYSALLLFLLVAVPVQAQISQLGSPYSSNISYGLAMGDLDGDGDLDLIETSSSAANNWYANNGSGVFTLAQSFGSAAEETSAAAVADFDQDGLMDVVVVHRLQFAASSPTQVYLNSGAALNTTAAWTGQYNEWNDDVAVGDFNADGYPDVVVTTRIGAQNRIYINDGLAQGSVSFTEYVGVSLAGSATGVTVGRFNGDIYDDIVFSNGAVLASTGAATFSLSSAGASGFRVDAGDLNNDGNLDLVFTGNYAPIVSRMGTGNGSFGGGVSFGETGDPRFDADLADINNDGNLDLIIAGWAAVNAPFEYAYTGDGDGTFTVSSLYATGERAVIGADVDGDGDDDIATSYPSVILQNRGPGSLEVVNTNDGGEGSLRAAIHFANSMANGGSPDEITFNIPGAGPHTITLATALPNVTDAVTINGYSQPGSSANTASGFNPINADIRIQVDASGIPSGYGINLTGHSGSEVRGLVVYGGPANALNLSGGGHKVKGSFIGNDGVNQFGTGGIHLNGGTDDEIGGPNPADRNIIMGGVGQEPAVNSPLIQGNYFGIKANGTEIFTTGRTTHSISSNQATFVEVRDNVIAGATWRDISITHANNSQGSRNWTIINNRLGTDYTGTSILPAASNGIYVQKGAHDNLFQQNIIAGHSGAGILITQGDGIYSPLRNQIRRNSMFGNGNPGIALLPNSDPLLADANDGILAPTIDDVRISMDGSLVIPVSMVEAGTVEFFEADAQHEEGERYFNSFALGAGGGVMVFPSASNNGIQDGDWIVVTLTDADGNTSQFSNAIQVYQESLVVTNTNDSGPGSLRNAITLANGNNTPVVPDTIWFNIPGPGPHTISLTTALPTITEPVNINACTQPGAQCHQLVAALDLKVELDGSGITSPLFTSGLVLGGSGGSRIHGLVINGFTDKGIRIPSPNNIVAYNQIGTDVAGAAAVGMGGNCIEMHGGSATGNLIQGNLISGCGGKGIGFEPGATNNTVNINFVGTNKAATARLENGADAIESNQADNNTVTNNTIAGGISLNGTSDDWTITGNRIGNSLVSEVYTEFPSSRGIQINGNGNQIGGLNPGEGNIVRGTSIGINLGNARTLNVIQGNELFENSADGIRGTGATSSVVEANTIYANGARGVFLSGGSGHTIIGNKVGLQPDDSPGPNDRGIMFDSVIGSTISGNTVAYNTTAGIQLLGTTSGTIMQSNSLFNNGGPGIEIAAGAQGNREAPIVYGSALNGSDELVVVFEIPGDNLPNYWVELFEADSDAEEGKTLVWNGTVSGGTDLLQVVTIPDASVAGVEVDDRLVMTVTELDNTSGFSQAVWVDPPDARFVRTTANTGAGSLYSAIITANMSNTHPSGMDRILFDIEGTYPATINVFERPLPQINDPVLIDGGVDCSLNPEEYDFRIVLRGDLGATSPVSENALTLIDSASGSTIRGLVIHSFELGGIVLDTTDDVSVSCNAIGVAEDMVTPMPNGQAAVLVTNGGTNTAIDGNIFGTRSQLGYVVNNFLGADLMFEDNWVGVSPKNGALLQNAQSIVGLRSENGGREVIRNNVFGGYSSYAIELIGSADATVLDNFIGVTPNGTAVPNGDGMVLHSNSNNAVIQGNVIAENTAKGIRIEGPNSINNRISQNSFYANGGLAIDLGNDGFTANDANDTDSGPNNLQNHPILVNALRQSSNLGYVSVELTMDSAASIEFYLADAANQEGRTYLGTRPVGTPTAFLDLPFAGQINSGDWIVATATDANGNTSEFSGAIQVGEAPNAITLADQLINDGTTSAPEQLAFSISADIATIPGMTQALQAAFDAWDAVTTAEAGTKVSLNTGSVPETLPALQDGINLITQSSDAFPLSANTLAVASKLLAVGLDGQAQILGADIVFNRSLLANPSEGLGTDAQPGIWDVQAVATHELGHSMGLRHSGVSTATMFFSIPSGKSYRSLEVDDKAWISYRYPSTTFASLGSISGNVADGEGATAGGMLGGALVIAKNVDTGARIHAYSDADGDFHIPGVPAGNYSLTIQPLDGFVDNIPGMVPGTVSPYLASITEYAQFSEENWSGVDEGGTETDDPAATLSVSPGEHVTAINFVTNLDVTPPTVNGGSPSGLKASIRPDVAVTFSEPIIEPGLSITLTPAGGAPIAGTVQVPNAPGVVATFDLPNGTYLSYNTQYTISVSGATDKKGNTQTGTWTQTFTTRPEDQTAPTLVNVTPAQGATGVAPKTTLALAFSEPMNLESVRTGVTLCKVSATTCGTPLAGKWAFPSTTLGEALPQWVAIFTPDAMMDEGSTYRIVVSGSVKDQAAGGGNALGAAQTVEFQTVPDLAPVLVDNGPTDGAGNVSVRTSVFADFSEPMTLPVDGSGNAAGVTLTGALQGPVVGTVELLNEGRRVIFRPDSPLAFSDDFTAVFSNQITDATGHAITTLTLGFRTAAQPVNVTLETVSPLVSIPGSIVVFSGSGFNADPSLHTVLFPGPDGTTIPAEIDGSTLSTLSVIVPEGAKSGTVSVSTGGKTGTIDLEIYETIPLLDPAVARTTAESAPRDVEVTPDGGTAFVTNSGGGSVSVLDVGTGAIMATVGVGDSPLKVALTPDGRRAYVTNFGSNDVSVIDTEVGSPGYLTEINRIDVGLNPFGLAISPDGKRLYVAEYTSRKISIIDIEEGSGSADRAIARIGVEINERNIEEEPDGGVTRLGEESNPRDIEVSPDGGSLFFTTETLGLRVLLLDENGSADEDAATRRITAESSTRDVEISPDGGLIFVTTLGGALEAYRVPPDLNSTSSFQAVARLGEESNSREVEVSPDGGLIYVTNFDLGLVQVYSITSLYTPSANSASGGFALTFEPVTAYSVGDNPEAVVFSAAAQVAIVANSGSGDVSVLRFDGDAVTAFDSDGDGLLDDEELLLGTDLNNPDTDEDLRPDGLDAAPLDSTQWYRINTVHDEREETVDELLALLESMTGAPVVIPDEDGDSTGGAANRVEKEQRGGVKVNPYDDELGDVEVPVVAAKGKSKKSQKDPEEIAEKLLDALTGLAWNANPDKWIDSWHPVEDEGNEIFNRDRDAVKKFEQVMDHVDEETALMLTRMTDSLAALDWSVARITIDEAVAACDDSKSCLKQAEKAEKDLEKAQEHLDKGDVDKAIGEMRQAWNRMVKYLPEAAGKQSGAPAETADAEDIIVEQLPVEFELGANYPNPFNPSTTIEFALPEAVNVNLTVFDMLGRRIQVLVDGPMESGRHSVRFDASRLPSGMYLYRIQAGQKQQVRTMMLIK